MKLVLLLAACARAFVRCRRPAPAPRLRAAKEEAGHLLGFGDAAHVPSTLQNINAAVAAKADALTDAETAALEEAVRVVDAELGPPLDVAKRLAADGAGARVAIAAEFKRASPSKGPINVDADIRNVATKYASAGASLISVLTEPDWFRGSLGDLLEARRAVNEDKQRPALLRKDFVSRPVQVLEARAFGADAVLLIVACLTRTELRELVRECRARSIEPLVEVHTEEEMDIALETPGVGLIGVNNRNLHSFKLDMGTTPRLLQRARRHPKYSEKLVFASLSGVAQRSEVEPLAADVACVLVGEALMRAADPARLVSELRGAAEERPRPLAKVCGLTTAEDTIVACRAGADLLGVIRAPGSKRRVSDEEARSVVDAARAYGERETRWAPTTQLSLDAWAALLRRDTARGRPLTVGVVQDQPLDEVLEFVKASGVDCVQLHGAEDAGYAAALPVPHVRVLHAAPLAEGAGPEDVAAAADALAAAYAKVASPKCCAILVDAAPAAGALSGGAGSAFDWRVADALDARHGLRALVAGGLDGATVPAAAAAVAHRVGFDASSRLEERPGAKDAEAVRAYVEAVKMA